MEERNRHKAILSDLTEEIEALKGQGVAAAALQRPGTASAELAQARNERDKLLVENKTLQNQLAQSNQQLKEMLKSGQASGAG